MEKALAIQINRNRTLPNIKAPNLNIRPLYIQKRGNCGIDEIIKVIDKHCPLSVEGHEYIESTLKANDLSSFSIDSDDDYWNLYNEENAIVIMKERFANADSWIGGYQINIYSKMFKNQPEMLARIEEVYTPNSNQESQEAISRIICEYTDLMVDTIIELDGIYDTIKDEMGLCGEDLHVVIHKGEKIYFFRDY